MASASSSSSIMASPRADDGIKHDVFLSFSGDTRKTFTNYLYRELTRQGIVTFRDNQIERGEVLMPEIERKIKESRASIVVLSEKYAKSTWCLDELVLILEQRMKQKQIVIPVFYRVDPSDVGKQEKSFKIQVQNSSRWTEHNVNRWKAALTEVRHLAGFHVLPDEYETTYLKEIVDTTYRKLENTKLHLPSNLTGMDARYDQKIKSWLEESDYEFLAICGMGGSGKTTLAKHIYNLNWKSFENASFLEDISSACERHDGLRQLQAQLLEDILGGKEIKLSVSSYGTSKIVEALQTKRVFIVLDGIEEQSQLKELLGGSKINGKVIITTRRSKTDDWFKSTSWKCKDHTMILLEDKESLELLSLGAFGSKSPKEDFEEIAWQAVRYCAGNPLALTVTAAALSESNNIFEGQSQLDLMESNIDAKITGVLQRSYASLHYLVRELFLHIACFLIGKDIDHVQKILEHDYKAIRGIQILTNRNLLSVSPNKKVTMHPLLQEMAKDIVRQESPDEPEKRSRIWRDEDSYNILKNSEGSKKIKGLALDMEMLRKEKGAPFKPEELKTDALKKMDKLILLKLNYVKLTGSHEGFSEDLRWLCWFGFHLRTVPSKLDMQKMVALDMSYSKLEVFEPPEVLHSLQILDLKDSHNLVKILNISKTPKLETFILSNCRSLVQVCETIGDVTNLTLLNMTGCKNMWKREQITSSLGLEASTSGEEVTKQSPFPFPYSLEQLFLDNCDLERTEYFPLSFSVQLKLQHLNLRKSLFESLPCYDHLINLRVLDLSFCERLKCLLRLPSTLAELYVYDCKSLEKITFQSPEFTLQQFGYEGCINLSEIEGYIKLVTIDKLDETDMGHMNWLKKYQHHEVPLVGDDELTNRRSKDIQMLCEFNIWSTSLPDIKDPNVTPEYISHSPFLSFDVPMSPGDRRLKGLNVTFKYTISGDNWAWFAKINTNNGVDLMYSPKVFGKPELGEVGIWLSYWPIGTILDIGDEVNVSIVVVNGLEIHECGVSLVYLDDELADETPKNNMEWVLGGNLSGFKLSTGAYYLCRRDFLESMEVGSSDPLWFDILVDGSIDYTEIRGWKMTSRSKPFNLSFAMEESTAEISKPSFVDKPAENRSTTFGFVHDFEGEASEGMLKVNKEEKDRVNVEDEVDEEGKKKRIESKEDKPLKEHSCCWCFTGTNFCFTSAKKTP